jgi:MFS family permease
LLEQLDFYCKPDMMIGLVGALFLLGIVVGCLTLTRQGDVYGRKPLYILGLAMQIGFTFGIVFTTNYIVAYILLFILGMSVTAKYYVGFTYLMEIQPEDKKVMVSTTLFVFEASIYLFVCIYFRLMAKNWKVL